MLLDTADDLDVLDLAHHSGQAIQLAAKHQPTVLVLEAELPTGDLNETLAAAKAAAPATRLLVPSGDAHPDTTATVLGAAPMGAWPRTGPAASWRPPSATSPQADRRRSRRPRSRRTVTRASSCACGP
jgi:DNA-binding NarL/FixJ family response regulator